MLLSELYKIMVKKLLLQVLGEAIALVATMDLPLWWLRKSRMKPESRGLATPGLNIQQ